MQFQRLLVIDAAIPFQFLDQFYAAGNFAWLYPPTERQAKTSLNLSFQVAGSFFAQSLRERFGLAMDEIAVEHVERLRGLRGDEPRFAGAVGFGKVEIRQRGRNQRAFDVDIN